MIKHVFCDIGDVLIEWDGQKLCAELAKESAKPADFFLERLVVQGEFSFDKYPEWSLKCDNGLLQGENLYYEIARQSELRVDYGQFKKIWCDVLRENAHGVDWLKKMQDTACTTSILSNIGDIHFEYLYDRVDVVKNCDEFVVSYRCGFVKPKMEIFKVAFDSARELRGDCFGGVLKRDECLFVDDRTQNCAAGEKFGFVVVQYDKAKPQEFGGAVNKLSILL